MHTGGHAAIKPGLPWLIGGSFYLFGVGTFWPVILAIWAMGLASLALVYRLLRSSVARPTAVAITCLVGINQSLYEFSLCILTDIPFLFGLLLFLVGYEGEVRNRPLARQRWLDWAAMLLGITIMAVFRSVVLTFSAALAVTLIWHALRSPHRWRYLGLGVLAVAGIFLFRMVAPRLVGFGHLSGDESYVLHRMSHMGLTLSRTWHERLPNLLTEAIPESLFNLEMNGIGIPISICTIVLGLAMARRQVLWGMLILAYVAQIVLLVTVVRYMLPLVPLFAAAWWFGVFWLHGRLPAKVNTVVCGAMLVLWILPNVIGIGNMVHEQWQQPFYEHYEHDGRYARAQEMAEPVRHYMGRKDLLLGGMRGAEALEYFAERPVLVTHVRERPWKERVRLLHQADDLFVLTPRRTEMDLFLSSAGVGLTELVAEGPKVAGQERWRLYRAAMPDVDEALVRRIYDRMLIADPDDATVEQWLSRWRDGERARSADDRDTWLGQGVCCPRQPGASGL